MDIWTKLEITFIIISLTVLGYLASIATVRLITEAECLEKGYPEAKVTYKYDRYCTNLDGTVTFKVDKL